MGTTKSVLVVEDDEDILSFVDMLLSGEGYDVRLARDGFQGLKAIGEQKPSVILVDVTMPGMDGWEFASRVRGEYGIDIPIVILSAGRDLERKAFTVGADDVLPKPFDVDDLVAMVKKWTERGGGSKNH